jgi:hypothetical protein
MLKQFKIIILAPTCFGSRRNHHQGAVLCLGKTTKFFSVLVGIDAVNVMAAYQPVVRACGSQWRQELVIFNIYYLTTTRMVTRTRLDITFIRTAFCIV